MKNKLVVTSFIVLTIVLSGCVVPGEEEVKADMDQMFSEVYPELKFNYDDFRPQPSGCYKTFNPIGCSGPNELEAIYEPQAGFKHLSLRYSFVIQENSSLEVMTAYYADYIYNEYLYDESLGNNVDEMFKELEKRNYKYYLSGMYIANTSLYDTIEPDMEGEIGSSPIYIKDENKKYAHQGDDYVAYVEGKDVKDIDFHDYMEFMSYYPVLTVYIDAKNSDLTEEEVKVLEEEMKSYYDTEAMHIYFYAFDRVDAGSSHYLFMDSKDGLFNITPEGQKPTEFDSEPTYNWQ